MKESEEVERVSNVVSAWLDGDYLMFDACVEEPEIAWRGILEILKHDLTEEHKALLAGGPLETLLARHGPAFIDRVVTHAQQDSEFNHLLGGVWRQDVPVDIWERIIRVRKTVW